MAGAGILLVAILALELAGCASPAKNTGEPGIACAGKSCSNAAGLPQPADAAGAGIETARRTLPAAASLDREPAPPWTIALATEWNSGKSGLGKPRGRIGEVGGRLGSSAAVGGSMLLAGGPIGALLYGGLLAVYGVTDGIESGKAGRAIHKELEKFQTLDNFEAMVHQSLQRGLTESGIEPAPRLLRAVSGRSEPEKSATDAVPADTSVQLTFKKASLKESRAAWQYSHGFTPRLVLVIDTRMQVMGHGAKRPLLVKSIRYKGSTTQHGVSEEAFERELRRAADFLAGEVLRHLGGIPGIPAGPAGAPATQP